MDFEEFEVDIERAIEQSSTRSPSCNITGALNWVDSTWYAPASRNARWMDLIGDYAGAEPFVIDGTYPLIIASPLLTIFIDLLGHSLLQLVLDDPLLALAKDDGKQ